MTICHRFGAMPRRFGSCAALALLLGAGHAHAGVILGPGEYALKDHPDGGAAPPTYGLRLDELINVTGNHDVFTFSFDHPDADMHLNITEVGTDEYRLHIHGQAYGGLIQNHQYVDAFSGLVDIHFIYMLAHPDGSDDDLIVTTPNFTNTGHIIFEGQKIDLFDRANADGYTFQLGDEDGGGHRGFDGISGWGWLDHGVAGTHVYSSDWLFTVVPTPGSAALMSIALAIFIRHPRRR